MVQTDNKIKRKHKVDFNSLAKSNGKKYHSMALSLGDGESFLVGRYNQDFASGY